MSSFTNPPKLALKLLRLYCSEERIEEIEGDLNEVYNEFVLENGSRHSKLFFWWLIIRNIRSYSLKRNKMKIKGLIPTSIMFLKHNVTITWRSLLKHKATSLINISGLTVGISAFLVIFTIIQFELSFNTKIPDADRIYRVTTKYSGSFDATNRGVAIPITGYAKETFSGLESISNF